MTLARRTWEPGPRALQCYTLNLRSIASTNLWLNPTPLRRAETAFSPGLSQLLRTIQRGLEGATHRHSRKPRVQHACKLVLPSGGVNQAPARHGGPFHRRSTAHRFERARLHSGSRAGYRSQRAPRQAGHGLTGQGGSGNMSFASRLRYWVRVSSRRFPIPRLRRRNRMIRPRAYMGWMAAGTLVLCTAAQSAENAPLVQRSVRVEAEVQHDTSIPLRQMPPPLRAEGERRLPVRRTPRHGGRRVRGAGPVFRSLIAQPLAPVLTLNFDGVGNG